MKPAFLQHLTIHSDWQPFLTNEMENLLLRIEKNITQSNYTPSAENVLRFFELPLQTAKVIILGQDPYPQQGAATGRAFEVGNLTSWNEAFKNISLKNILRAIYKSYTGKIIIFNALKQKLDNEFPVLPPGKLFKHWESQGVLLLNTSFTCITGKPGSHKKEWEEFTALLLHFINVQVPEITWFLWGKHAINATQQLSLKNTVITHHPMMCYDGKDRENDFLYGKVNGFAQLQNDIDWTGFGLKRGLKTSGTLF
ncbi:MAG TPA: uracil-DNA glycosylase [Draconibacterium sp.]|nr:uracil-DNA glycosylase [Draconibacterium sp.]